MDAPPPLTVDSLRQFAADEKSLQEGLQEDCQALEDVMVRLAGPTLQGIEEDTAKLEELQQKLAAPALEGIKLDMRRITKILRKLHQPIDQAIAEDTTLLTGIAARARGSNFPAHRRGFVAGRAGPNAGQVVSGATHPPTRPTGAPVQSSAMGYAGVTPIGAPFGGSGYSELRPSPIPAEHQPEELDPGSLYVTSGASGGGQVALGPDPYAPPTYQPPAVDAPYSGPGLYVDRPTLQVSPTGPAPLPPTPFTPPSPQQQQQTYPPTSSQIPLQQPGIPSPFQPPSPPIPIPDPPPPLPPPPPAGCDLCTAALHLADVIGGQLLAIAQTLHCLCEQIVKTAPPQAGPVSGPSAFIPMFWTDPPGQEFVTKDSPNPDEDWRELFATGNKWGS